MADVTRGSASVTQSRRLSNAFKQTRLSCKRGRKHLQEDMRKKLSMESKSCGNWKGDEEVDKDETRKWDNEDRKKTNKSEVISMEEIRVGG